MDVSTQVLRLPPFSTAYSYPIELTSYYFNTFHLLPILRVLLSILSSVFLSVFLSVSLNVSLYFLSAPLYIF
jgi:hypothetical protein